MTHTKALTKKERLRNLVDSFIETNAKAASDFGNDIRVFRDCGFTADPFDVYNFECASCNTCAYDLSEGSSDVFEADSSEAQSDTISITEPNDGALLSSFSVHRVLGTYLIVIDANNKWHTIAVPCSPFGSAFVKALFEDRMQRIGKRLNFSVLALQIPEFLDDDDRDYKHHPDANKDDRDNHLSVCGFPVPLFGLGQDHSIVAPVEKARKVNDYIDHIAAA